MSFTQSQYMATKSRYIQLLRHNHSVLLSPIMSPT